MQYSVQAYEGEAKGLGVDANCRKLIGTVGAQLDPGSYVFRLPVRVHGQDAVSGGGKGSIREFARHIDALLELLDSTANALAATWDTYAKETEIEAAWNSSASFKPPIQ